MPHVIFDRPDQLEKIKAHLIRGEQLLAVFDLKGLGHILLIQVQHPPQAP